MGLHLTKGEGTSYYSLEGHPQLDRLPISGTAQEWMDIRQTILNYEPQSNPEFNRLRVAKVPRQNLWRFSNPDYGEDFLEVSDYAAIKFAHKIEDMLDP